MTREQRIEEALRRLCDCLHEMSVHPEFIDVFCTAQAHRGSPYKGPTWVREYELARTALTDIEAHRKQFGKS